MDPLVIVDSYYLSEISLFIYWYTFFMPFEYIYASKFLYSIFNGPQSAIAIGIAIKYFNQVNPSLVLLGSGTINIVKYGLNAVSGSFVGMLMQEETQKNSILIELVYQYIGGFSFFAAIIVDHLLRKKKIDVSDAAKK